VAGSFKRLVATVESVPTVYDSSMTLQYADDRRAMRVSASMAYLAGGRTLTMPDLSTVSGWPSSFAIPSAGPVTWAVTLDGNSGGPRCAENYSAVSVTVSGSSP
jgi:hypothetical protein